MVKRQGFIGGHDDTIAYINSEATQITDNVLGTRDELWEECKMIQKKEHWRKLPSRNTFNKTTNCCW